MTREEFDKYAIENDLVVWSKEMSERAIKALEQEPILDKIRAEIEEERVHNDWDFGQEIYYNKAIDDVLQIIDKYRQEG